MCGDRPRRWGCHCRRGECEVLLRGNRHARSRGPGGPRGTVPWTGDHVGPDRLPCPLLVPQVFPHVLHVREPGVCGADASAHAQLASALQILPLVSPPQDGPGPAWAGRVRPLPSGPQAAPATAEPGRAQCLRVSPGPPGITWHVVPTGGPASACLDVWLWAAWSVCCGCVVDA